MKIAIVGAAGGIGRACAVLATRHGHGVGLLDADTVGLQKTSGLCLGASYTTGSVAERKNLDVFMELENPDAVIVAHGVRGGGKITEISDEEWQRVIEINLTGTFNVLQSAARVGAESIVLLGSISGMVSNGFGVNNSHYCASKGGVIALGRAAAVELAEQGIRVNIVCPGPIDTPMLQAGIRNNHHVADFVRRVPLGHRAGTPEDVAELCLFLCSDASKYITGAVIPIDGGYTAT